MKLRTLFGCFATESDHESQSFAKNEDKQCDAVDNCQSSPDIAKNEFKKPEFWYSYAKKSAVSSGNERIYTCLNLPARGPRKIKFIEITNKIF